MLGQVEIECTRFEGNEFLLQLAEIDENLIRNELDPISIGELAIKRDEILELLGQRAIVGAISTRPEVVQNLHHLPKQPK